MSKRNNHSLFNFNYRYLKIKTLLDLEKFLNELPTREFGKYMSEFAPRIICNILREKRIYFTEPEDKTNAPHFDLINQQGYTIQVKFRHVTGKTAFSKQTYLHNWRQKLQYNVGDFHFIVFILWHNDKRNPVDWKYSFVKAANLKLKNGKLKSTVSSELLLNGSRDWTELLKKAIKK